MAGKPQPKYGRKKTPHQHPRSQTSVIHRVESSVSRGMFGASRKQDTQSELAFRYYSRLQRLKDYVEAHHAERISLHVAANIAHLEKKYFSAYFHRKIGVPYTHWLTAFRIKKAIDLITNGDNSLTQIAAAVGFENLRTFERSFKKLTTLSPIKFRKYARPS